MLTYGQPSYLALIGTVASPETLTDDEADTTVSIDCGGIPLITIVGTYTPGATESDNYIEIIVEESIDGTNYYQQMTENISSGTVTMSPQVIHIDGATAETAYPINLHIPLNCKKLKISAREVGKVTNFGTLYLGALLAG